MSLSLEQLEKWLDSKEDEHVWISTRQKSIDNLPMKSVNLSKIFRSRDKIFRSCRSRALLKSSDNLPIFRHNLPMMPVGSISALCANLVQMGCKTTMIQAVKALENQSLNIGPDDNSLQPVCKSTGNNDWRMIA